MSFREDLGALVLSCLVSGPAHGYEISKRIRNISDDALSVAEGKLYPALHALENDGDIVAEWIQQGNRPPRKVYELTERGRATLAQKRREWQSFQTGINAVLKAEIRTS